VHYRFMDNTILVCVPDSDLPCLKEVRLNHARAQVLTYSPSASHDGSHDGMSLNSSADLFSSCIA
jgi:hypothetical protein